MTLNIYNLQPILDIYPWPNGLGFRGSEEWWVYVCHQTEEDKLDLLIIMAHLSDQICELLLVHDQELLSRFQFSSCTLEYLSGIQAKNLIEFATALVEQNIAFIEGCI